MDWKEAVNKAKNCDVTFIEWCNLYYSRFNPTKTQQEVSSKTARRILIRNGLLAPNVEITLEG